MGKKLKIGLLGLVHDHIWLMYKEQLQNLKEAKVTCAADDNKSLLDKSGKEFDIPSSSLYPDAQEMINNEDLDACLVFSETSKHAELTEICAKNKVHVMLEKPMTTSFKDAKKIKSLVDASEIRVMVNYPFAHSALMQEMLRLAKSEELGRIWHLRWRMGHNGPETQSELSTYFVDWLLDEEKNGGGAMSDFCSYGAIIAAELFGLPQRISASTGKLFKKEQAAEDNGIILASYDKNGGAMAVLEGTWSQNVSANSNCVIGDKGAIITSPLPEGGWHLRKGSSPFSPLEAPPLPEEENGAIKYFLNRLINNQPFEGLLDFKNALIAQQIISAAYESAKTGKTVALTEE